jgi:hypothetical protein
MDGMDISVNDCLQNWVSQNYKHQTLPAFICWNIWLDINNSIFEDRTPSMQRIVYLVLGVVGSGENSKSPQI